MKPEGTKGWKRGKPSEPSKKQKNFEELNEIEELERLCEDDTPPLELNSFNDMPLSSRTKKGLNDSDYLIPTEIQKNSVLIALKGIDVLGAAKTGSGKTLAFLIPVLEKLYRKQWTKLDGLGALIITPTRELAMQIYQTLVKVGKYHDFSAGLIIGGKDLNFEKTRMHLVNIIIGTPGRLLHHMDENPLFSCTNLQVLVLDEADRCLDMGFEREMNSIVENLPSVRQSLLFSATQTKKVKDLARLSLNNPSYISVHEHEKHKTPPGLIQSYVICEQHDKLTMLWSFIKTHPKQKIIIFFATCNQVKFIFDIVCKLRPYNTLLALHGKIKQEKRMATYDMFCRKQHAVLFATDLASRGLDFPEVHWVIHADCPEDVDSYIHRSGRTARYYKGGESLLLLNSSEKTFIELLDKNRIPINEIKVNPNQLVSPQAKLEAFLAKDRELKASAQRAFVSYAKSVYLMKDKSVFDISKIDNNKFARSLGLVVSPRIRFIEKAEKAKKNLNSDSFQANEAKPEPDFSFYSDNDSDENEGGILKLKRRNHDIDQEPLQSLSSAEQHKKEKKPVTKAKIVKRILHKKIQSSKSIFFDEEGEAVVDQAKQKVTDAGRKYEAEAEGGLDIEEAQKVLKEEDAFDRKLFKQKLRAKRQLQKLKLKADKKGITVEELKIEMENRDKTAKPKGGDEVEEDSGSEPDLSWLPDPDVVYKNTEDHSESDSEGNRSEESSPQRGSKRKFSSGEESENDDSLTLKERQELALKLMSSKKQSLC